MTDTSNPFATMVMTPFLESLFDGVDAPVYLADPDTHEVLFANKVLRDVFGDPASRPCHVLFHNLPAPCPFCTNDRILGENFGHTAEWECRNKVNNRWYRCMDWGVELPDGRRVRCEIAFDVTDHRSHGPVPDDSSRENLATASALLHKEVMRRKAAEDDLHDVEERYRALFEASSEAIAIVGLDGLIIDNNRAARELTGVDPGDVIGKHFTELGFVPKEDIAQHMETFTRMLLGQTIEPLIVPILDITGKARYLEVRISELKRGGQILAFMILCRDVTAQKRSEQIIHRKMELEQTISRISSRFVGRVDLDKAIKQSLGDACDHTGATRGYIWLFDDLREKLLYTYEWRAIGEPAHKPRMPVLPNNVYQWGERMLGENDSLYISDFKELPPEAGPERALLRAQGIKSVFMLPIKPNDEIMGYIGFNNTDTSLCWDEDDLALLRLTGEIIGTSLERRRAETAMRDSEARFRRLAETSPDLIMHGLPARGMDYVNPAVVKILGYTPDEVCFRYGFLMQIIHPEDQAKSIAHIQRSLVDTDQPPLEFRMRAKNGEYKWLEGNFVSLMDKNGQISAVEILSRDITERKRAEQDRVALEQQLLQAQKMEAIGTLAGGMAHEFNNMLAVILGTAEMCSREFDAQSPHLRRVHKIMDVAERARDITMKLLTFARKEKLNVRTVSLNSIVADTVEMLERSLPGKTRILARMAANLPPVNVDATQMQQALLNVGLNAGDAMPDGGDIILETERMTLDAAFCATHPGFEPGTWCAVHVRDSGCGIPPEITKKIFEPFFTTKAPDRGTGLGLSITLGIVRNHGGNILAQSAPGGAGAVVSLFLPASTLQDETQDLAPAAPRRTNTETVLVVDNEPDFLEITIEALETEGFRPLAAPGGAEALDLFDQHRADIDLVLLDLIMPDVGGAEVFHALRRRDPHARIILCSGYSMDGLAGELMAQGAAGFMQKPFRIEELSAKIREVMDHA